MASTYIANGAKVYGTGVTNVGDGLYELKIRRSTGAKWDTNPPYPWPATIPWPQVPGDPGETDGGIEDFDIFKLYFKIRFTKV